ncbi:hypothetical protein [Priestia koreensis]|uniref:YqgU-like 6-bladed beta-propeller domain-containing protein n=1 Tax=Priestia koreensis TaxID=284581 RepID=A0A0M0KZU9_9BACI|nr:hypothetical protein [Priestia koreensis]KOO43928.1 hypothetical protein AMD01_14460 [Priestia koreensis]
MKKRYILYAFLLIVVLLAGCEQSSTKKDPQKQDQSTTHQTIQNVKIISVQNSSFYTFADWYDNRHVFYIENHNGISTIFLYDLYNGSKKEFFKTPQKVITLQANPSHTRFVLYTSKSEKEASLLFLDKKGNEIHSVTLHSFDIQYSWNPTKPSELIVTGFGEDWSFNTYLINIQKHTKQKIDIPQPFAQWLNGEEVVYLDWKKDQQSLQAPLRKMNMKTGKTTTLEKGVGTFSMFPETLLAVKAMEDSEKEKNGTYEFYSSKWHKMKQFSAPVLSNFSGWLLPYSQFDSRQEVFYTYVPYQKGDASEYKGGFDMVSFSLKDGKMKRLFKGVDNIPFKLSPDGTMALYGYQLEEIMDLTRKEKRILANFSS